MFYFTHLLYLFINIIYLFIIYYLFVYLFIYLYISICLSIYIFSNYVLMPLFLFLPLFWCPGEWRVKLSQLSRGCQPVLYLLGGHPIHPVGVSCKDVCCFLIGGRSWKGWWVHRFFIEKMLGHKNKEMIDNFQILFNTKLLLLQSRKLPYFKDCLVTNQN